VDFHSQQDRRQDALCFASWEDFLSAMEYLGILALQRSQHKRTNTDLPTAQFGATQKWESGEKMQLSCEVAEFLGEQTL
jgi:hypothetical protein